MLLFFDEAEHVATPFFDCRDHSRSSLASPARSKDPQLPDPNSFGRVRDNVGEKKTKSQPSPGLSC
jgi:hypothetical protein